MPRSRSSIEQIRAELARVKIGLSIRTCAVVGIFWAARKSRTVSEKPVQADTKTCGVLGRSTFARNAGRIILAEIVSVVI